MIDFLFKRDLDFEIKNEKIILRIESPMKQFAELFKDKFKKLFDRELEVEEIKEKPDEKTIKNHNNPYKH
jgi:hypothetical protein